MKHIVISKISSSQTYRVIGCLGLIHQELLEQNIERMLNDFREPHSQFIRVETVNELMRKAYCNSTKVYVTDLNRRGIKIVIPTLSSVEFELEIFRISGLYDSYNLYITSNKESYPYYGKIFSYIRDFTHITEVRIGTNYNCHPAPLAALCALKIFPHPEIQGMANQIQDMIEEGFLR